jgi:7,8-dihydro-6-hydroxymethylpterin-pyrophosphokinase
MPSNHTEPDVFLPEHTCIIGLGANVEKKTDQILKAIEEISSLGNIEKRSALYKTQPWGNARTRIFLSMLWFPLGQG